MAATRWQNSAFCFCLLFACKNAFFVFAPGWENRRQCTCLTVSAPTIGFVIDVTHSEATVSTYESPPPLFSLYFTSSATAKCGAQPTYRSRRRWNSVKSAAMGSSPSRTINIISLAGSLELQRAPGSPLGMFWSLSCNHGCDGCARLFIPLISHAGSM